MLNVEIIYRTQHGSLSLFSPSQYSRVHMSRQDEGIGCSNCQREILFWQEGVYHSVDLLYEDPEEILHLEVHYLGTAIVWNNVSIY